MTNAMDYFWAGYFVGVFAGVFLVWVSIRREESDETVDK